MRPAARRDFILHANLAGLTYEIRTKYRQDLLNLTLDDLKAAEQTIEPSDANACIIGTKRQIQNIEASILQLKHL
jgi:Zn-dependent M16 (insulinase) family peptidase